MADKNRIIGPMEQVIPGIAVNGFPILIAADMPEGGFLQIVSGANPLVVATPSVQIPRGFMVALIPADAATAIRPGLTAATKQLIPGMKETGYS